MGYGALLSALPALPDEIQRELPIALDQFWWRVSLENDEPLKRLVEAVLLMRGVINIVMAREGKEPSYFASLSRAQVQEPAFYPDFAETVSTEGAVSERVTDELWIAYFEYALETAVRYGSPLLAAALRWEIGLRNVLVERRAANLDLDPAKYRLLEDEGLPLEDYAPLLEGLDLARSDPRRMEHTLGQLRLDYLEELRPWASTGREAIVDYALRLLVLKHASVFIAKESTE